MQLPTIWIWKWLGGTKQLWIITLLQLTTDTANICGSKRCLKPSLQSPSSERPPHLIMWWDEIKCLSDLSPQLSEARHLNSLLRCSEFVDEAIDPREIKTTLKKIMGPITVFIFSSFTCYSNFLLGPIGSCNILSRHHQLNCAMYTFSNFLINIIISLFF